MMGPYIPIMEHTGVSSDIPYMILEAPSVITPFLLKKPWANEGGRESSNQKLVEEYIKETAVASLARIKPSADNPILAIKDYYKSSVAEMLINIGLSRVKEFNLEVGIKRLKSKIKRGDTNLTEDLEALREELGEAKRSNKSYQADRQLECPRCPFRSEFSTVMSGHLEIPHLSSKREYMCNRCEFKIKDCNQIVFHNLVEHKQRCRIEKPPTLHLCRFCPYECKSKRKMVTHLNRCEPAFQLGTHLGPQDYTENDFPAVTAKFISKQDVEAYEHTLKSLRLAAYNPHQLKLSSIQPYGQCTALIVPRHNCPTSSTYDISKQATNQAHTGILQHPRTQSPFANGKSVMQTASEFIMPPINQLTNVSKEAPSSNIGARDMARFKERQAQDSPSIEAMTISPTPNPKGSTFVICEICDGYIKDLSQLKSHMQWIHKVKIHQKMLISRPPLNCQKCQWRFFTDQGLERHLLGAHGLVTSNMQELVDQGVDSGRCTVCGRAYANKLVAHMKEVHKTNLKPAHLSYKCTVCSATFNLYRLFENHVYSVHSESVKRVSSN